MTDGDESQPTTSRRLFLRAAGAAAAVTSLAGCSVNVGSDGASVNFADNGDADGGSTETTTGMAMTTTTPDDEGATTEQATTATQTETTASGGTTASTTTAQTTTTQTTTATTSTATDTTTTATPAPREGGTLQLIGSRVSTLDPVKATDSMSVGVVDKLYDGLTTFPHGSTAATTQLATDISTSDGGQTYTVTLDGDATFHDGTSLTASDVVYSWERLAGSRHSRRAYLLLGILGMKHERENGEYKPHSLAVKAVDDRTVRFVLEEPLYATPKLLAHPSFAPVPEGIVGDIDGYHGRMAYEEFARSNPVGTGPFRFESWTNNTEIVVSRFADYHGQAADLDRVRWTIFSDESNAYQYGQNGNADFPKIPADKYDHSKVQVDSRNDQGRVVGSYGPMSNGKTVSYVAAPLVSTYYIGLNAENVEKPARQALMYVLNQHDVVDAVLDGRAYPAYFFTPPGIFPGGATAYQRRAQSDYPYGYDDTRIGKARQVMENAGYGPNNKYELTLTRYQSQTWGDVSRRLRSKLDNAHVTLNLETASFTKLISRGQSGDLDAYTLGWIPDYPAPENFLELLYPPNTDTAQEGGAQGAYVDWMGTQAAKDATSAWKNVEANMGTGSNARQNRESAFLTMEEANWTDALLCPMYTQIDERFAYDGVDVPAFGNLGSAYQQYTDVVKHRS